MGLAQKKVTNTNVDYWCISTVWHILSMTKNDQKPQKNDPFGQNPPKSSLNLSEIVKILARSPVKSQI